MAILLLAEWDETGLSPETEKAYSAARQIDSAVDILLIGAAEAMAAARQRARRLPGLRRLCCVATDGAAADLAAALNHRLAEPIAALLYHLRGDYSGFIAAATACGKNIMPRLAGLLNVGQVSDIISVEAADVFCRPIYAGNIIETVRVLDAVKVITVRAGSFAAPEPAAAEQGEEVSLPCPADLPHPAHFAAEKRDHEAAGLPDLGSAEIVVSGGRGLGSAEDFKRLIEPLAERLNAAIGASRAAVDAGFIGNDHQVGQTGRNVAPKLYIAIGLSGAAQHLAGMMDSQVIVAINNDAEAPIFQVADYGLVGDLFEIVPALTALLPQKKC